jgi:hypothetical protein
MTVYESGNIDQTIQAISPLSSALNSSEIAGIAAAFKKSSPIMAAVIANASDPMVAKKILQGAKIEKSVVSGDAVSKEVQSILGNAVLDPAALNSFQDAIFAHYKQSLLEAGKVDSTGDSDILEASIESVVGKLDDISIGGEKSRIIIPKDMTVNDIEDVLSSVNDDNISNTIGDAPYSGNTPLGMDELRNNARVVSTGDGKYGFIIDGLGYVLNKDGGVFEIDARKTKTLLAKTGKIKPRNRKFDLPDFG